MSPHFRIAPAAQAGVWERSTGGLLGPPVDLCPGAASVHLQFRSVHDRAAIRRRLAVGGVGRVGVLLTGVPGVARTGSPATRRTAAARVAGTRNERSVRFGATGRDAGPGRRPASTCRTASTWRWPTSTRTHASRAKRQRGEPRPGVRVGLRQRHLAGVRRCRVQHRADLGPAACTPPARSTATNGASGRRCGPRDRRARPWPRCRRSGTGLSEPALVWITLAPADFAARFLGTRTVLRWPGATFTVNAEAAPGDANSIR